MSGRTVPIELGGHTRHLRFDLNALAAVGDELGIEVRLDSFAEDLMSKPLPFSALRVLLWAALLHEEPSLTVKDVGAWVDSDNVGEVSKAFFSLFNGRLSAGSILNDLIPSNGPTSTDKPSKPNSSEDGQTSSESPSEPSPLTQANSGGSP